MHKRIKDFEFTSYDFTELDLSFLNEKSFVYCDPPYTISVGSYNDGKRGFKGWNKEDDLKLFNLLDRLNDKGIKFALSNVTHHKGEKNEELIKWSKKYKVYKIDNNFNNCNYQNNNSNKKTVEVLIINY